MKKNNKKPSKKELTKIAHKLGYKPIKNMSHNQIIFKHEKRNIYISYDIDSHNGGFWKKALNKYQNLHKKSTREGTYNKDLTKRIGD